MDTPSKVSLINREFSGLGSGMELGFLVCPETGNFNQETGILNIFTSGTMLWKVNFLKVKW